MNFQFCFPSENNATERIQNTNNPKYGKINILMSC